MSEINEDVQEEVVEQEEVATTEEAVETDEETQEEETVTLKKSDYTKLNRKAIAYDSTKGKTQSKQEVKEDRTEKDFISTVFMVKDLSTDEFETLKGEAEDLGVPLERYIGSESGKTILSKLRSDKKSKDVSQPLTSKSPVFKKHTAQDLKGMSSKELAAILPHD